MPTPARQAKQYSKWKDRRLYNTGRKIIRANDRQAELAALGKTLVEVEKDGVKSFVFPKAPRVPPSVPRLVWLGGKQAKQQGDSRKNRSHFGQEHASAVVENASRTFTKEVDKALTPTPEPTPTPEAVAA
jgi:hypothetical protein